MFDLAFSADGSLLVTASRSGNVIVWKRSPDGDRLSWIDDRTIDGQLFIPKATGPQPRADIWAVDVSADRSMIAVGLTNARVCLVWLDNRKSPFCSSEGHDVGETVKATRFQPGKPILVSAGNDNKATVWDIDLANRKMIPRPFALHHRSDVWDADFSRDGRFLATASFDGSINVYDTQAWRLLITTAPDKSMLDRMR